MALYDTCVYEGEKKWGVGVAVGGRGVGVGGRNTPTKLCTHAHLTHALAQLCSTRTTCVCDSTVYAEQR